MSQILGPDDISQAIQSLADSIEQSFPDQTIHLVGIRSRGDIVAERILALLNRKNVELGVLDISLYRDDFSHRLETPKLQSTELPFEIDEAHVILIDDVLFTGRTIRAALDALYDYGRPANVQLAVLIDRGHRELPIEANYVGKNISTERDDHINVDLTTDSVTLAKPN